MVDEATTEHVTPEELADYFEGKLPEDRECMIEEHLAECKECTEEARGVHVFAEVWQQWSARAHGEAYWRVRLVNAIEVVAGKPQYATWRERLVRWREVWGGRAEAALRVLVGAKGTASKIETEGLDMLARAGAVWRFALVLAPAFVRGTEAGAMRSTAALSPGRPRVRVAVNGDVREVVVRVDGLQPGQAAPLVLLIPAEEGREAKVAEPQRQPGVDYLIARFEHVESGDYLAAFEPMGGRV